jgi:hypothetical protein
MVYQSQHRVKYTIPILVNGTLRLAGTWKLIGCTSRGRLGTGLGTPRTIWGRGRPGRRAVAWPDYAMVSSVAMLWGGAMKLAP